MLSFGRMIHYRRILPNDLNISLTLHCTRNVFADLFHSLNDSFSYFIIISANSSLHEGWVWIYIMSMSGLQITNWEDTILASIDISRHNCVKRLINLTRSTDRICQFVRSWAMAALSTYFDLNCGACRKKATFTNSNIPFIKIWHVVESIYFVHILETLFFYHGKGPTRAFLRGLEKQPNSFITRHLWAIFDQNTGSCH